MRRPLLDTTCIEKGTSKAQILKLKQGVKVKAWFAIVLYRSSPEARHKTEQELRH